MGYFKDWQKRNNIHEALNRLPGGQQPVGRPADGQELHKYISNTPQDVGHMEQEADRKELEEAMKNANEAGAILASFLGLSRNRNKQLADYIEANPELERELSTVSSLLYDIYKYLYVKWRHLGTPTLSQAMTPPPDQRPQGMN